MVNAEEDDERARTMEFFIDVAGHSRELRDFNAVMEIISGLHNASVSRLKVTERARVCMCVEYLLLTTNYTPSPPFPLPSPLLPFAHHPQKEHVDARGHCAHGGV